jgi:23S rRNA (adenine2030-N6)-methyltransferase
LDPQTLDYSHRFHVGNHGDVWKHVLLLSVLHHLGQPDLVVLDTHAGEGQYRLGPTGEWTAGVGRVWDGPAVPDPAIARWLAALAATGAGPRASYPGSPRLILDALGPGGRLHAAELQADAAAALRARLPDPRLTVREGDGLAADVAADLVLIDPPYVRREEWAEAVAAAVALRRGPRRPVVLLWYPIKSWNRPNAVLTALRAAEEPFVALDLVVTPIELRRPQLAGSGMVLLGAPPAAIAEALAAAAWLGPRLATHGGRWQVRVNADTP